MANETPAQQRRKAAIYTRVSTFEQHPETQLHDLRQLALQRGFQVIGEFSDRVSGIRTRRPGLDELLRAARRRDFDVLLVWSSDRLARSVRHFLELLEECHHLGIEFVSFREAIDTGGPLGRASAACSSWLYRKGVDSCPCKALQTRPPKPRLRPYQNL